MTTVPVLQWMGGAVWPSMSLPHQRRTSERDNQMTTDMPQCLNSTLVTRTKTFSRV